MHLVLNDCFIYDALLCNASKRMTRTIMCRFTIIIFQFMLCFPSQSFRVLLPFLVLIHTGRVVVIGACNSVRYHIKKRGRARTSLYKKRPNKTQPCLPLSRYCPLFQFIHSLTHQPIRGQSSVQTAIYVATTTKQKQHLLIHTTFNSAFLWPTFAPGPNPRNKLPLPSLFFT